MESERQPRLVSRCRIGVQNAFVDGMVDERQRGLQKRFRSGFVLGFQRCAEFPDLMPQLGQVRPVQLSSLLSLLDAL